MFETPKTKFKAEIFIEDLLSYPLQCYDGNVELIFYSKEHKRIFSEYQVEVDTQISFECRQFKNSFSFS